MTLFRTQILQILTLICQVWFQNRRAKFRRNERSVLVTKTPAHSHSLDHEQVEQPLVPKNASGDTRLKNTQQMLSLNFLVSTVANGSYPTYTSTWRPPASPSAFPVSGLGARAAHTQDSANLFSAAAAASVNPACYSQELRSKMSDYSGWRY